VTHWHPLLICIHDVTHADRIEHPTSTVERLSTISASGGLCAWRWKLKTRPPSAPSRTGPSSSNSDSPSPLPELCVPHPSPLLACHLSHRFCRLRVVLELGLVVTILHPHRTLRTCNRCGISHLSKEGRDFVCIKLPHLPCLPRQTQSARDTRNSY
jgi:hypothetical protein